MKDQLIFNKQQLDSFYQYLAAEVEKGPINIKVSSANKQRTLTQNKALHLYFKLLSDALNDGGYNCFNFFKEGFAVPWNKELVKELIWKPIQEVMLDEQSTAKANTVDYSKVYDVINAHLIENKNIFVPWPDRHGDNYGN